MTYDRLQIRRGTASQWSNTAVTPLQGEPTFDVTNNRLKIGDGTTAYSALAPIGSNASDLVSGTLNIARIPTGTSSTTVCIGNDSRLSDARTPTAHVHSGSDITSGTIGDSRLSANVPLKNAANTFTSPITVDSGSFFSSSVVKSGDLTLTSQVLNFDSQNRVGSFVVQSVNPNWTGGFVVQNATITISSTNDTIFSGDEGQRMLVGSLLIQLGRPFRAAPYTFATVPSALSNVGATIRITDRNNRLATSDGLAWNWAGTTTAIS